MTLWGQQRIHLALEVPTKAAARSEEDMVSYSLGTKVCIMPSHEILEAVEIVVLEEWGLNRS